MRWLVIVGAMLLIGVGLWLVDRLLLAAEGRGWIYWRRSKPSSSSVSNAFLSVQGIFEPGKEHIVEERRREEADIDVAEDDDPVD